MTITLQYKYLMHDIDQWTYRLGKTRITDDAIRNEAQSSSVATDVSFYRRKIVEAIANIRTMLKNRLYEKTATGSDTLSVTATSWSIILTDGYYNCDAQSIADLMHKYVVRSVMTEWAITYAPDSAASLSSEQDVMREELLAEVYTRKSPELSDHALATSTITVTVNNQSYGTVEGTASYAVGSVVTIKANANDGYKFTQWTDGSTDNPRIVTVGNSNATYTATFASNT